MSIFQLPSMHYDNVVYSKSGTRLVDEITYELRISIGFAMREALRAIDRMTPEDRQHYMINVARRCPSNSRACRTHIAELAPQPVGDIGAHVYEQGVGDSIFAFALSDTLLLAPDLGQLVIRNHMNWPDGQAVHGAISVRRLARGIVDRRWKEGEDPEPVKQFALDMVMVPLEGLRQYIKLMKPDE